MVSIVQFYKKYCENDVNFTVSISLLPVFQFNCYKYELIEYLHDPIVKCINKFF